MVAIKTILGLKSPFPSIRSPIRGSLPSLRQSFVPNFQINVFTHFDRTFIKKKLKKLQQLPDSPMRKAALLIRLIAQKSIRKAKMGGKPSRKLSRGKLNFGQLLPPKSRSPGHPFRRIRAEPLNALALSWIIGSEHLGSQPPIPGLHEHGGTARRRLFQGFEKAKGPDGKIRGEFPTFAMGTARYPKRAFMKPALKRVQHKLPELWRNSIRER